MYLDKWELESKGGMNYITFLLKMLVKCSACKQNHRVEETFEVFAASRKEKNVKEQILQEIKKMRPCPFCGVMSVLTQNALSRVSEELTKKIKGLKLPVRISAEC
jgi:hypothetical protein